MIFILSPGHCGSSLCMQMLGALGAYVPPSTIRDPHRRPASNFEPARFRIPQVQGDWKRFSRAIHRTKARHPKAAVKWMNATTQGLDYFKEHYDYAKGDRALYWTRHNITEKVPANFLAAFRAGVKEIRDYYSIPKIPFDWVFEEGGPRKVARVLATHCKLNQDAVSLQAAADLVIPRK